MYCSIFCDQKNVQSVFVVLSKWKLWKSDEKSACQFSLGLFCKLPKLLKMTLHLMCLMGPSWPIYPKPWFGWHQLHSHYHVKLRLVMHFLNESYICALPLCFGSHYRKASERSWQNVSHMTLKWKMCYSSTN